MTTFNDILTAIKELVQARYPNDAVYLNWTPTKFQRPSFLVENLSSQMFACTPGAVEVQTLVRVSAFVEDDAYSNSQLEALNIRQYALFALFSPWYLPVGGRAVKVVKMESGPSGRDYCYVHVTLSWTESLQELSAIRELPVAEHVNINMEVNHHE